MRAEQQDLLRARRTRQRRLQVGANDVACFVFLAVNPITLLFEDCLDVVAGGGEGLRTPIVPASVITCSRMRFSIWGLDVALPIRSTSIPLEGKCCLRDSTQQGERHRRRRGLEAITAAGYESIRHYPGCPVA